MKRKAIAIILATTISLVGCGSTTYVKETDTKEIHSEKESEQSEIKITEIESETTTEADAETIETEAETTETEQDNYLYEEADNKIDINNLKLMNTTEIDNSVINDFEEYDLDTFADAFNIISETDEAEIARQDFARLHHMTPYVYATTCDSVMIVKNKISDIPIEDSDWIENSLVQKLDVIRYGNTDIYYIGEQNGLYFYCIDALDYDEAYSICSWNGRDYDGHEIDILINPSTFDNGNFITKVEVEDDNKGTGNEKCVSITCDGLATVNFRYDRPANQLISMLNSEYELYEIMLNGTSIGTEQLNENLVRVKTGATYDTDVNIRVYNRDDELDSPSLKYSLKDPRGFSIVKNNNTFDIKRYTDKVEPYAERGAELKEKDGIQYSFQRAGYQDSDNYSNFSEQAEDFDKKDFLTYDEYVEFCRYWGLEQKFTDTTKAYAVYSEMWRGVMNFEVENITIDKDSKKIKIETRTDNWGATGDIIGIAVVIPVQENEYTSIEVNNEYTPNEFDEN